MEEYKGKKQVISRQNITINVDSWIDGNVGWDYILIFV